MIIWDGPPEVIRKELTDSAFKKKKPKKQNTQTKKKPTKNKKQTNKKEEELQTVPLVWEEPFFMIVE